METISDLFFLARHPIASARAALAKLEASIIMTGEALPKGWQAHPEDIQCMGLAATARALGFIETSTDQIKRSS